MPLSSYFPIDLSSFKTIMGITTIKIRNINAKNNALFSFFNKNEGIAIPTDKLYYPSGLPNFKHRSFLSLSVKHSYALVSKINFWFAYGSSGFLSGCKSTDFFLKAFLISGSVAVTLISNISYGSNPFILFYYGNWFIVYLSKISKNNRTKTLNIYPFVSHLYFNSFLII